jgi:tripartite-type tricarboxylate transporter receptor subunit TctC
MKGRIFSIRNYLMSVLIGIFCLGICCAVVTAQEKFPAKTIKIFQGSSAGGTTDLASRMFASLLTETFGVPVISVAKIGGANTIAADEVAHAKPDGYTVGYSPLQALTVSPLTLKVKYNPLTDFDPLCNAIALIFGVCVREDAPWKSMKELVEYARANPGVINYSTAGAGTNQHLAFEYIGKKEKIKWNHVPYPGGAPAVAALLGGHVKVHVGSGSHQPYLKSGKFRMLAAYMDERIPEFPDVPTLKELGYNVPTTNNICVIAPKGLPEPTRKTLEEAFSNAAKSKPFISFVENMFQMPLFKDSAATKKTIEAEYKLWSEILDDLGMKAK